MAVTQDATFVDTIEKLQALLTELVKLDAAVPELFIDLEGDNISCGGPLSILQLLVFRTRRVYLIDLHVLGKDAFSAKGTSGPDLKSVLESSSIAKAFFDVRGDSNALFIQYNISLAGVQDIQLMELATRQGFTKCVNGLARCIEHGADLTASQRGRWQSSKEEGKKLFDPKLGGSYAVFNERPLSDAVKTYCVQDVLLLPVLWWNYSLKLGTAWSKRVTDETSLRLKSCQKSTPLVNGRHMALGPTNWMTIPRTSFIDWSAKAPPAFRAGCAELAEQLQQLTVKPPPQVEPNNHKSPDQHIHDRGLSTALYLSNMGASSSKPMDTVPTLVSAIQRLSMARDSDSESDSGWEPEHDLNESAKDFTACSADDCGYCGHCDY